MAKFTFNAPPAIGLPGAALDYTENDPATIIDATATASDTDSANFDTGTLTIDFTANGTADDRLAIRDQGTGIGNIQVSGNNISYQPGGSSILIGTFTGGTDGSTPLVITLNSAADATAVQALLRNITYENVSENPSTATRTVRFVLTDGDGGTSNAVSENINFTAVNDAPTFGGGDGIVTTDLAGNTDIAYSTVIQPDGKVLVGGYANNGGNYDFAVTRYHADGGLDTDFGNNGTVLTDFTGGGDTGRKLLLQDDGKILLGGYALISGNLDFAVARYNADGSVDTSFGGGNGKASAPVGSNTDGAYDMVLQVDGKIVLAGMSNDGTFYEFAMVRFLSDGSLDSSFGGLNGDAAGTVTTDIGANTDTAYAVALQPDGKILLAGTAHNGVTQDIGLTRYNTDGSLDTSFGGGDGKVTTSLNASGVPEGDSGNQVGYDVAVQSDGKILVAGSSSHGGNETFTIVRYNANGTLDTSFGGDGVVSTDIHPGDDRAYTMTLQDDDKILLSGYSSGGPTGKDFALVRYDTDGSLDATFDGDGKVTVPIASSDEEANSVTVQADGKIVAVGLSSTGMFTENFQVLRFNSDGSLESNFDTGLLGANPTFIEGGAPVVLDSDVTIFDAELSAADNFDGASLTLVRNGGANAEDVFSANGNLAALTEGGNLVLSGVTIGTVTTNSAGQLVLTFNANATQARVDETLQSIAYSNNGTAPPASVQIDWTFDDGNTGAKARAAR